MVKVKNKRYNMEPVSYDKIAENFKTLLKKLQDKLEPYFDKVEYCAEDKIKDMKEGKFLFSKSDTFLQQVWWNDWHENKRPFAICSGSAGFVYKDGSGKVVYMTLF